MSRDSQASFSQSVRQFLGRTYGYHCSICLNLVTSGSESHSLDSAAIGAKQLSTAVGLGILPAGYQRSTAENGIVLCPLCHIAYFTPNHIALSPPPQVLQYIVDYLLVTPAADLKDLYEVFDLLLDAAGGLNVDLPDPARVLPYLGLFTLVVLTPEDLKGHEIATTHLPNLSILHNNHFIPAPDASPTAPNVARIFDVLATIHTNHPKRRGHIPLSPQDPEFLQQRYWRLPTKIGIVLTSLIQRIGFVNYSCEEIGLAQNIRAILSLSRRGLKVLRPSISLSDGGSSEGGVSGGGGPSSGGPTWPAGGDPSGSRSVNKRGKVGASESAAKKSRREAIGVVVGGGDSESGGEGGHRSSASSTT